MVVEDAYERHSAAGKYLDIPIGVYIVRSENLVLLAELVSRASCPERGSSNCSFQICPNQSNDMFTSF